PLYQVRSAVPRRRLARIFFVATRLQVHALPQAHEPALIERKAQIIGRGSVTRGRDRAQVRPERVDILIFDLREGRERQCRVQILPASSTPFRPGALKLLLRPTANPNTPIRSDIGRIKHAKRRLKSDSARESTLSWTRMTADAVSRCRKVFTPFDR